MIILFLLFFQTLSGAPADSRELFVAFYPPSFVEVTLEKNGFPDDKRIAIIEDLMKRELDVPAEVDKRVDPAISLSEKARVDLYSKVVFEIFAETLKQHGMEDPLQARALLDDIQEQKIDKFKAVIK